MFICCSVFSHGEYSRNFGPVWFTLCPPTIFVFMNNSNSQWVLLGYSGPLDSLSCWQHHPPRQRKRKEPVDGLAIFELDWIGCEEEGGQLKLKKWADRSWMLTAKKKKCWSWKAQPIPQHLPLLPGSVEVLSIYYYDSLTAVNFSILEINTGGM